MARQRSDKLAPPPRVLIVAHGQPSDPGPAEAALAGFAGRVAGHLAGWRVGSATLAAPGALAAALADLERGGSEQTGRAISGPGEVRLDKAGPDDAGDGVAVGGGRSGPGGPAGGASVPDGTRGWHSDPVSPVDRREPDAPHEDRSGGDPPDGRLPPDAKGADARRGEAGTGDAVTGDAGTGGVAGRGIAGFEAGLPAAEDPPRRTPPGRQPEGRRPEDAPPRRLAANAADGVAIAGGAAPPDPSGDPTISPPEERTAPAGAGSAFSATGGEDPQDLSPVLIFPMFMADGWFTRSELPRRLAEAGLPPARMRLLAPFGTDPAAIDLAEAVLRAAVAERGWRLAETHLLLAAHGSFRSPAPAAVARRVARVLVDRLRPASLATGFIDQAPQVAAIAGELPAPALCLPFFALAGGHVEEDLPAALASAAFPGVLLPPLGQAEVAPTLVARALRAAVAAEGDRRGPEREGTAAP